MAEYLNRLYSYKDKVDSYEYNEFMNLINKNDYNSYRWALLYLDKVFDSKLKDNMNNKLSNLKYNLQLIELKRELIYVIISILTIILSYIIINISKYSHRFIKKVDPLYIRNIPNDLSLVSSGILIDKEITSDEVTASILDLIRRKIIIKDNHFENGDVYIKNEELINNIDSKDECLLKMIFGTEKSINFKKIRIIDKIRFNSWKGLFINELKGKEFINLTEQKPIQVSLQLCVVIIILLLIGSYGLGLIIILLYAIKKYRFYLPISLLLVANFISIRNVLFNNHFFYYSIILNIISIIIICLCTKKIPFKLNIKLTKKGEEKKKELYALRNFLNDFSRLNEKEIPEVYLWEQYLVYATLFGIGNKVLKSMKLKIEENNLNINLNSVLLDSINVNSFDRISNNISSMSAPKIDFKTFSSGSGGDWGSSSSSSGSGGGFSGGSDSGGSFGGGSGGGRF